MPHPANRRRHPHPPGGAGGPAGPLDRFLAAAGLGVAGAAVLIGVARAVFGYTFDTTATLTAFTAITSVAVMVGELSRSRALPLVVRRWLRRAGLAALCAALVLAVAGGMLLAATPGVGDAEARVHAQAAAHGAADSDLATPPKVAAALVATEDARFFTNPGIDPSGALRALLSPLRGGEGDTGGATIEQQLAKMLYTNGQRTHTDQIEQVALALKLAHHYPKSQILEMYLATAYFGHGYYGLQAASRGYFHRTSGQLDWPQAALLSGLVQAPSAYDPVLQPRLALQRRTQVLQRLVDTGYLTAVQARAYAAAPLDSPTDDGAQTWRATGTR
ncbi:biosynthetic peptidoglycan transglycosylase [Streptomyces sp. NPDC048385]|uniref:biosynthetic peptidoglycan transglycosylase n=1 Tax=unclassified Streptomyces TaxID=2593676 RepID=UPI00343C9E97